MYVVQTVLILVRAVLVDAGVALALAGILVQIPVVQVAALRVIQIVLAHAMAPHLKYI